MAKKVDIAYTVVEREDGTFIWLPITSEGNGASPSNRTPSQSGVASAGTENRFARGDHVHPHDIMKQDVLFDGVNIKTINGESVLGVGNIVPGSTGEVIPDNVIDYIQLNGVDYPAIDKNVNLPLKTINNQSLLGNDDLIVKTDYEDLSFGGIVSYNGKETKTIPIYDGSVR